MARKTEPEIEDNDLLSRPNSSDDITEKVQRAQEELLELKRKQEEIEGQKRELEELKRQQIEFREGRREILEKLTRGLVVLERQEVELKREVEQVDQTRRTFEEQLQEIQGVNPEKWEHHRLAEELTRALAKIDQAQALYAQSRARLAALQEAQSSENPAVFEESESAGSGVGFFEQIRSGFAYSIPAILFAFIWLLIFLSKH
jgi:chromosome segregation ATPase